MSRRLVLLSCAAIALAACGKKEPSTPPPKTALETTTSQLNYTRPCSATIPEEWSPSFPIPALKDSTLVYKVFFAGWEGNPKKGIKDHDAEGDATFAPDGTILSCTRRGNEPAKYPAHLDSKLTNEQLDALRARLYALTEQVAAEYASGKPDRAVIADYSSAFAQQQDPELAASYRALSPEFWKWLEANGGSGPKPR